MYANVNYVFLALILNKALTRCLCFIIKERVENVFMGFQESTKWFLITSRCFDECKQVHSCFHVAIKYAFSEETQDPTTELTSITPSEISV